MPGIPKKPAIIAVMKLISIPKLKYAPIKFVIYNNITPKIPFINIFIGHFNYLITRYKSAIPIYP